ncbi:MAG: hypothetical protein JWL80_665 [Parcubacteria group bacterium]|nr:hypothetical protein [Parcubacteria group bacterium]
MSSRSSENILVIDISSGSVGASLVHKNKKMLPEVVHAARIPFFTEVLKHSTLEKGMLSALDMCLEKTLQEGIASLHKDRKQTKISNVMIVFSSPWITTKLATTTFLRKKKTILGSKEIEKIIKESSSRFKDILDAAYKDTHEVFESVAHSSLQGNEFELYSVQNGANSTLIRSIEDMLLRHISMEKGVLLQSFMFVLYKVLAHSFADLKNFTIIEMGEEMTDLMVIKKGIPSFSISLPFGSRTLAKAISKEYGTEIPLALSLIRMFSDSMLDTAATRKLDKVLSLAEEQWIKLWKTSVTGLEEHIDTNRIFLIASEPFGSISKVMIQSIFPQNMITLIGHDNAFARELARAPKEKNNDEKMLIEATFSTFL